MKTRELPEKISPGDVLEVQLAPFGDFPNVVEEDGRQKKFVQRFGPEDAAVATPHLRIGGVGTHRLTELGRKR